MHALWVVLGIVVLGLTLLDVFLSALNYDESGFLAGPLTRLQWRGLRSITRRLSRRWRPVALRQVTGLQIMLTVVVWLAGVVIGFALIYYGLMYGANFQYDGRQLGAGVFSAVYLSAAQLATVGTSQISPETDILRVLTIAETLVGLVLVTMILTFLFGVYQVIRDLRALSSNFFSPVGAGDPVASLIPYFPRGRPTGLDSHLQAIHDSFGSYADGVRLHHAAYYFQSGRARFSLPYAVRMLGGVIAGLRWGLPAGHPASLEPVLIPLQYQFLGFADYLQDLLGWKSVAVPQIVPLADFTAAMAEDGGGGGGYSGERGGGSGPSGGASDAWVLRFLRLNRQMARLCTPDAPGTSGPGTPEAAGEDLVPDPAEAYARYRQWLPFAYRAQQLATAVSRDLDYQPILLGEGLTLPGQGPAAAPDGTGTALGPAGAFDRAGTAAAVSAEPTSAVTAPGVLPSEPQTVGPTPSSWRIFLSRWVAVPDPGLTRLRAALRAVLAAAAAAASLVVLFTAAGGPALPPAIFGAIIGMQTAVLARDATATGRKVTTVLSVLPAVGAAALGAVVAPSFPWTVAVLVVLALAGVGIGLYGPRWAALGQLAFMSYYFALLLHLPLAGFLRYAVATAVGVLWAFLLNFVFLPERPGQVLRGGVDAFGARLVLVLNPLIDAVAGARWDPDVRNRVRSDLRQLHRSAAFLGGRLAGTAPWASPLERRGDLRLRLFDTELAAGNLAAAVPQATGAAIPVALRARLAGLLVLLQDHLRSLQQADAPAPAVPAFAVRADRASGEGALPAEWPEQARRLHGAMTELLRAADALRQARAADLADPGLALRDVPADAADTGVGGYGGGSNETAGYGADVNGAGSHSVRANASAAGPRSSGRFPGPVSRHAVQAAAATGVALLAGSALSSTYQYWAALPAFQLVGSTDGETVLKGTEKILGTVAGAAAGFAVAIYSGSNPVVILPLVAVCLFAAMYFGPVSSPLMSFWQTMMFAQLYEFLGKLTAQALEVRVLETVIGAVIAFGAAALLLPTRTRRKLNAQVVTFLRTLEETTRASLQRLGGVPDPGQLRHDLPRLALALNQDLLRVYRTAVPLRHSSGALGRGGIENRLTALTALTYYARHLVAAAELSRPGSPDLSPAECTQFLAATTDNISALIRILDNGPEDGVHAARSVPEGPEAGPGHSAPGTGAVRQLRRINQTLLVLAAELAPDPAGSAAAGTDPVLA